MPRVLPDNMAYFLSLKDTIQKGESYSMEAGKTTWLNLVLGKEIHHFRRKVQAASGIRLSPIAIDMDEEGREIHPRGMTM